MGRKSNCFRVQKSTYFTANAFKIGEELKHNALYVAINFHNICEYSSTVFPFIVIVFSYYFILNQQSEIFYYMMIYYYCWFIY